MSALVRDAAAEDAQAIDALLADAFSTRAEADLVAALRRDDAFAAEFVAEAFGDIVGYAGFPKLAAEGGLAVAALAPLAVDAEARRRGVGAALVHHGLMALAERGLDWCLVLGEPGFYGRFGFSAEKAAGFATPYDGPHQLAVSLKLTGPAAEGSVRYPAAFAALG